MHAPDNMAFTIATHRNKKPLKRIAATISLLLWLGLPGALAQARLDLLAWEDSKDAPVPCRIHLKNEQGEPVKPPGFPFWRDHFVFNGKATLDLSPGMYHYELERGPEYRRQRGTFLLKSDQPTSLELKLKRLVDLPAEGWWPGDLHVHRDYRDIELLASAESLAVAPVITWWNVNNPWENQALPDPRVIRFGKAGSSDILAGEDEREGGALLYFNLPAPLPIQKASREFPSPMQFLEEGHRHHPQMHVDIEKPFWWDVPVWLASGMADTIGLANNHMCRGRMLENEAWGHPRDAERLPPPRGNGFWTQEIYYHILNTGLRLPPSAGSASGVLPNPVGYNRVYVHVDGEFNGDRWWQNLRRGRSFVSNGPLLRVQANETWPGEVLKGGQNKSLTVRLTAKLDSQDPVREFEIIQNGRLSRVVSFDRWQADKSLGTLEVTESGWFLVRVVVDRHDTFRFASTAPWYVEFPKTPERISRASVEFFLEWMKSRMDRIHLTDPEEQEAVMRYHRDALAYWRHRLDLANAP